MSQVPKLRNLGKMRSINDGTRTLFESVLYPELIAALTDWKKSSNIGVLVGGVALSYYCKPRLTQDIMLLSDTDIPALVNGFRKTRAHGFEHLQTQVEIEIVTPEFVNIPVGVCQNIMQTAVVVDGLKIASPSGLVASKLFRLNMRDKSDIIDLINSGQAIDVSGFGLPQENLAAYIALLSHAEEDKKKTQPIG